MTEQGAEAHRQAGRRDSRSARGALEQAVFLAVYRSRRQRALRMAAFALLLAKHFARGLAYLWPVGMVLVAIGYFSAATHILAYLLLLLPGVLIWLYIYLSGARKDYQRRVRGRVLRGADLRHLV